MGLGPVHTVSLADARTAAVQCRQLLLLKIDPITARDAKRAQQSLEAARSITFSECADLCIKARRPSWKNVKHANQWTNTINTYCGPVIGHLSVQDVDTELIIEGAGTHLDTESGNSQSITGSYRSCTRLGYSQRLSRRG